MVFLINGNSLRNNRRDDLNKAQLASLQSKYGRDWQAGVAKDPSVTLYNPDRAKNAKVELEKKHESQRTEAIKEGVMEMVSKRSISGVQADKLMRAAEG